MHLKDLVFGYSLSSFIATLGIRKGTIFIFSSLFLQNIIIVPAIFALAVSGIRLYKSIMKEKKHQNIKIEIIEHTIFFIAICFALIVASLVETYISSNLIMLTKNIL